MGKVIVAGGQTDETTILNTVEEYFPVATEDVSEEAGSMDNWTNRASMMNPRAKFSLVVMHNFMYAIGGHKIIERYNGVTWEKVQKKIKSSFETKSLIFKIQIPFAGWII